MDVILWWRQWVTHFTHINTFKLIFLSFFNFLFKLLLMLHVWASHLNFTYFFPFTHTPKKIFISLFNNFSFLLSWWTSVARNSKQVLCLCMLCLCDVCSSSLSLCVSAQLCINCRSNLNIIRLNFHFYPGRPKLFQNIHLCFLLFIQDCAFEFNFACRT